MSRKQNLTNIQPWEDDLDNIVIEAPALLQPPSDKQDHIILADKDNYDIFIKIMAKHPNPTLHGIRVMEIHIDTAKLDAYLDFRIALALHALHPANDGTNPHRLQYLRIIVEGAILFTRHNYHLASPAASVDASHTLQKLIRGTLSKREHATLAYQLISTESGVAKALLAIRGVENVVIEGKGKIEGNFAQTLLGTLTQPSGTDEVQSQEPQEVFCVEEMYTNGLIYSEAYKHNALQPYSTPQEVRYNLPTVREKQRCSMGKKMRFSDEVLYGPEGAHEPALNRQSSINRSQVQDNNSVTPDPEVVESDTEEDEEFGLGIMDMVRVRKDKNRRNDLDDEDVVEFGWKV